jgi:hypothetical protein
MQTIAPSRVSIALIAVLALINVVRGTIHVLAPDGGLEMIAGLDIAGGRQIVLSFIAAVGAGQLAFALVDATAVFFRRDFIRPLLLVHTVEEALGVFVLFVWRPLPHAVPGQWGALAGLVIIAFFAAIEFSRVSAHAKS